MQRLFLIASMLWLACIAAYAAPIDCKGQVVDEQNEPMVGALVTLKGTQTAVVTNLDGYFSIKVPDNGPHTIVVSSIGYKSLEAQARRDMGTLTLEPSAVMLHDVVVTQSIGKTRETPVAMSTIAADEITLKSGAGELLEVLKTTPGVYTIRQGGGFGDAETRMRGFKSENVAMMVNGIPINDMEWGGVYQSNWAGLSDVASSIQTQRGLGATIVSTPSVGGTINITTRTIDVEKGGSVWYGMGNDGMNLYGAKVSTGLMSNGWAVTVLGSRKWGDGYIQGADFNSYNYFLNVSKRINDSHQVALTAFGAPQWHNQRSKYDGLNVMAWQSVRNYMNGESPYRYNPVFGYDRHGRAMTGANHNVYHKPQISLNHIWQINERSSLSTALYMSIASGYGLRGEGRTSTYSGYWYGADSSTGNLNTTFRCADGTFDYAAIQEMNAESKEGSLMSLSRSVNDHEWYGLVSSYKHEFAMPYGNRLNLTAGIDLRYYIGKHKNVVDNLMDGAYMIDRYRSSISTALYPAAASDEFKYAKLGVGDIVYRHYNGYTAQEGIYAQGEYTMLDKRLNIVLSGALNNNTYWRREFFYADKDHERSATKNFLGGTIKGGANYNIDRRNNVFFNAGYISRAPFFSRGVFINSTNSNEVNPHPLNERVVSFEIGYGYHSQQLAITFNGYYTKWMDKTTSKSVNLNDGTRGTFTMQGVNARHMGLELAVKYIPARWVELDGMVSLGDWEWANNPTGYYYDSGGLPISSTVPEIATGDNQMWSILNQKGVKVGGMPQTTASVGVQFKPFKGFNIGGDWTLAANNYSDLNITADNLEAFKELNAGTPWKMPWGQMLDLNASYTFDFGGISATIYGNVNNLFNYNYINQAYTPVGAVGTWENAYQAFYTIGRTWSVRMRVNF